MPQVRFLHRGSTVDWTFGTLRSTRTMTIGIEEKACMILESLSCHLWDGQVDMNACKGSTNS
jgi:hypothetical protein